MLWTTISLAGEVFCHTQPQQFTTNQLYRSWAEIFIKVISSTLLSPAVEFHSVLAYGSGDDYLHVSLLQNDTSGGVRV